MVNYYRFNINLDAHISKLTGLVTLRNALQKISVKWLLWTLVLSFVLSTVISFIVAILIIPTGPVTRMGGGADIGGVKRGTVKTTQVVTLTPQQQQAVIDRNIFNSEGAVPDGATEGGNDSNGKGQIVESKLPITLRGVIFGGDPTNGLALIENTQKRAISSFVNGDVVIPRVKLFEVYPDQVILDNDGRKEFKKLEVKELEKSRRDRKKTTKGSGENTFVGVGAIVNGPPPENFKEPGFERAGHNIVVTDDYMRNLLGPQMTKVLQDAKAEPNMVGGQLKGFKLTRIREDSIYLKAGFQNGDVVHEINGVPLNDASASIRLLNQLRNEKEVEVRVERGGSFFNTTISKP